MDKPFWEETYSDMAVSTFSKGPTADVAEYCHLLKMPSLILDAGCGEGRNSIFFAEAGHIAEGFDISAAGITKAKRIAEARGLDIKYSVCDLAEFAFEKDYDAVLSHGVLHLPKKQARDAFIERAKRHTKPGGYHFIGIFTDRLPATPDNAPFTKRLFKVGELPAIYSGAKYGDWEIIYHSEGTFSDNHPGGIRHEHAYERIIAKKL